MNDRRTKLIEIFNDTLKQISEDSELLECAKQSAVDTRFYPADLYFDIKDKEVKECKIEVNENKTFQDVFKLHKLYPNKKICVLNFASATTPGGGVKSGSGAQEECLCRCSTLYYSLNTRYLYTKFYEPNKEKPNRLHTDDVIYSPNIKIIKTDDDYPVRLDKKEYIDVDIVTCAAPNLRENPNNRFNFEGDVSSNDISKEELYKIHLSRAKHILNIAIYNDVDILVLGAFGCGAFRNDPRVVAKAYKDALMEYSKYFEAIDFAIFHREYEEENYQAFLKTIK